jgi:hypothetical protein
MDQATEVCEQNVTEILTMVRKLGPKFPTMIWGPPGIGKTHATLDVFKDHEIVLVLAGCSEPTDISGIPFEYKHEGKPVATHILAPIWAYYASYECPEEFWKPMVIFFDDLVTGHEQTQAACFKVFGEHRVGNLKLRDDVFLIAAGNRVEDKSGAFEMPLALANRMKHYYAKSDVDSWVEWALEAHVHPLVVSYIRRQGQDLNRFAEMIEISSGDKAFATPRTWGMLSDALFVMDPEGNVDPSWLYKTAIGCVGAGVGQSFSAFCNNTTQLVKPEDICKNPDTARIPAKTEVDVLYATISALEYHINQEQNWHLWDKALQYVLRPELEPEFGLLIAKMATVIALSKLDEEGRVKAAQNPWFKKMYNEYGTYLANSGN